MNGYNKRGASTYNNNKSKRNKREVQLQADVVDDIVNKEMNPNDNLKLNNVKGRIQQRGHDAVVPKGRYKSNIKMEWVLKKRCKTFNLRIAMIGAIKPMKKVDDKS